MHDKSKLAGGYPTVVECESQELRLAEVLDAYLADLERGTAPDRQMLLARDPDLAEPLAHCLDGLEIAQRIGGELQVDSTGGSAQPSAPIPKQFGDFQILREAGRGGMGVVYEAQQLSIRRRVALKILPLAAVMDPRNVQRFQNEVQAAALLDHTHIVSIYSVGAERGVHYYAMQYIDGHTLEELISQLRGVAGKQEEQGGGKSSVHRDRLQQINAALTADFSPELRAGASVGNPPPVEPGTQTGVESGVETEPLAMLSTARLSGQATERFQTICKLIIQAAEGLDHAHSRGVLHRDVKPGNLLLDGTGQLGRSFRGCAVSQTACFLPLTRFAGLRPVAFDRPAF